MMEEDGGVKAPLTRLRRRLSIEQSEDTNSPGPSTPTKKRTGRLAAKPQLELIEENTPGGTSKRTNKKTAVKDITEALEEKPLTPGRRSARIKSNTSIISNETTHGYESPRAKRATRRNSHVDNYPDHIMSEHNYCSSLRIKRCDTTAPATPTKQTRQTKKESPSSIDKLETTLANKPNYITVIIIEESESSNGNGTNENVSLRKSPRLRGKKMKEANGTKESNLNHSLAINNENKTTPNELNNEKEENLHAEKRKSVLEQDKTASEPEKGNNNLSDTSLNMIKDLDSKPKWKSSTVNKSMSALEKNCIVCSNKKQRTNSLTALSKIQNDDGLFFSDSEISNKKGRKSKNSKKLSIDNSASGDSKVTCHDISHNQSKSYSNNTLNKSKNKENDEKVAVLGAPNSSKELVASKKSSVSVLELKTSDKENNVNDDNNSISSFLKNGNNIVQSSVFFEDSSDTDSKKKSSEIQLNSNDKCVPVVVTVECKSIDHIDDNNDINTDIDKKSHLNKQDWTTSENNGCEPMDIDETIPNNITICGSPKSEKSLLDGVENTVEPTSHNNSNLNKSSNKSKRESSISPSPSQNLEKTRNESKSTLIISQIKDVSSTDNSVCKSPNNKASDILSKSTNYEESKEKENDKKNISLDYSTSTPLQQKKFKKLGMQINTSIINSSNNEHKKSNEDSHISKKDMSRISTYSETCSSEEESKEETSNTKSKLLDDEANEASDDYESGDSRDESERQYEENNEIVEKGETLDSEDEMSNDTDYEKDSFVVSSNEEDNELLSGSGDDLSMSDKELTMSKKSKMKYNERKLKEQKKASKEMFEARHKSNESKNKCIENKQEVDSSDDSEDYNIAPVKKNKHLRLDSTHEDTLEKSNSSFNSKTSQKRLSVDNKGTNKEEEISTVFDRSLTQNDPLSTQIKVEPQTPMKGFNVSTVQIYDNIEEVEVDNNASFERTDQSHDALQITVAKEDDNSSISECSEIMNNYDSVLSELNNKGNTKVNVRDTSLNINRKNKKHCQEPIIDQLNLTVTKSSKEKKNLVSNISTPSSAKPKDKSRNEIPANPNKDASSDSIDLQLLFSEDINEFGEKNITNLTTTSENATDKFIPLKRTPGKINIFNKDDERTDNDENEINFIIDTEGTRGGEDIECFNNINATKTGSKKKKKKLSESQIESTDTSKTPPAQSLDSKKKKKKLSESQIEATDASETPAQSLDSTKEKKKLCKSQIEETGADEDNDAPMEISFKSSKKDRKSAVTDHVIIEDEILNQDAADTSAIGSTKKKNKNSESSTVELNASKTPAQSVDSKKKKKKLSESQNEATDAVETSFQMLNSGKKKNKSLSESQLISGDASKTPAQSLDSTKKKKKLSETQIKATDTSVTETSFLLLNSEKKKTKLLSETQSETQSDSKDAAETSVIESTKKKKKKSELSTVEPNTSMTSTQLESTKKKKKELSTSQIESNDTGVAETSFQLLNSEKKKMKLLSETHSDSKDAAEISIIESTKKKKKNSESSAVEQNTSMTSTQLDSTKKKKKLAESQIESNDTVATSFQPLSSKKKKKKKKLSESQSEQIVEDSTDKTNNISTEILKEDLQRGGDADDASTSKLSHSKKRKRKEDGESSFKNTDENLDRSTVLDQSNNTSITNGGQKKKRKISQNKDDENTKISNEGVETISNENNANDNNELSVSQLSSQSGQRKKNKKRKRDEDDNVHGSLKVMKQSSFDNVHVTRLPASLLSQLDEKPAKEFLEKKKSMVISTMPFVVEETRKRRNKPSNFLEESVYLNDSNDKKKRKNNIKKPKVLPFVPTATISGSGFTTNFKIKTTSQNVEFVAQIKNDNNFKNDYLYGKRIKRLGTYEMYKKQRSAKMSKF